MRSLLRPVLIAAGTVSLGLGVIGIFVPILPTTPFLLLSAACYARSSERFLHWLLNNRWFGAYIRNYREGRGMPRSSKILTLVALWATLGLSAIFAVSTGWMRLLLVVIGVGVTIHLLRLKTYDRSSDRPDFLVAAAPNPASDES